jgi:hypothetical protein
MALRPTKLPLWASVDEIDPITGNPNKVEPPLQWKNSGVKHRQPVPRQYINYNNDLICDWIEYIDEQLLAPDPLPNILGAVYPVGSIHLSINAANPATYGFPGTWSAISQGRALFGVNEGDSNFNAVRKTGGSQSHGHTAGADGGHKHGGVTGNTTLTIAQMPAHNHTIAPGALVSGSGDSEGSSGRYDQAVGPDTTSIQDEGGGLPHNHLIFTDGIHTHAVTSAMHLNPYYCVYIWERVS